MLALTVVCVVAASSPPVLRFGPGEGTPVALRVPGVALSVVVPVGIAVFTLVGPLHKGWAKKAGTPVESAQPTPRRSAIGSAARGHRRRPHRRARRAHSRPPCRARVTQRQVSGGGLVDLNLHLVGPRAAGFGSAWPGPRSREAGCR